METKNNNHYLSAETLLVEYRKSIEQNKCTDKLLKYFEKIARRFSTVYNYTNKSDRNAVINYAVAEAWRKWNTFDSDKSSNIFSFYTTMIANDLRIHYKQLTKGKSVNISIESLFTPKD